MDAVTLALIKSMAGNGSGSLPPVTSADNGKVLGVVDGAWAASEQGKKFIVTLTPTDLDYSGTMDKTVAEINAAYEAGQDVWFRFDDGNGGRSDIPLLAVNKLPGSLYPSFNSQMFDMDNGLLVGAYTGTTDDGTKQTYGTRVCSLTPAS